MTSKKKKDEAAKAETTIQTTVMPDDSPGFALAELSVWSLLEKQADDVLVLDLRGSSDVCDFFVIASGNSDVHVQALAKHLHNVMLGLGQKPKGLEGMTEGRWALLDFFDVVVHVFDGRVREYFQLEKLWGDAGRLDIAPSYFADPEVAKRHPDVNFSMPGSPGAGSPD